MRKPKSPFNKAYRLEEPAPYHFKGAVEGDDFDFVTYMAAHICDARISLISTFTDKKPWLLSHYGLTSGETPKDYIYWTQIINTSDQPLIVEDVSKCEEFIDIPSTKGKPPVAFFASIPLVNDHEITLGSLCVIDKSAKRLSNLQFAQLNKLAKQARRLLELKKNQIELTHTNATLEKNLELFKETQESNLIGNWELEIDTRLTIWNEMIYKIHELPLDFDHNKENGLNFYHPDYKPAIVDAIQHCIENSQRFDISGILITAKGNQKWVRITGRKAGNKVLGSFQDITKIKENELKFRGIFNSTFSFIGFLNTKGILLEANDTAVNMAGIRHNDVIGKYFWDCYWWQISAKTQKELKANFLKAVSGEAVTYEVAVWIANKTPVTILFSMKPLFDDNGNVIYVVPEGRPVQEIVDARRKFKSVIEGTNVGTWEWNVQTGETHFNDRWAEIVGYTLEELAPISIDTWTKLVHPEDLAESERKLKACFDSKAEYYDIEVRMKHKHGHWVWVYDRGKVFDWTIERKPLMMYGTHQDITIRKNKELTIAYQEDILNALYKLSPIGIALNDYVTGQFIDINQKLLEPTGYSKEEFLALSLWDVTPKEYEPIEQEAFKQMSTGGSFDLFEKEYIRKDGTRYPVKLRGMVIEDLLGKKLIWSFIQDISEEKEAERKLYEAINSLQAVLDASTQVSIIATDPTGIITLFNSGAEIMLGYSAAEMIGKQTPESIHLQKEIESVGHKLSKKSGEDLSGFDVLVFEARQGQSVTNEWTYIRKDGSTFPALLSVTAIHQNNHLSGFLGVAVEISELKKVQTDIKSFLKTTKEQNDRLKNFAHIVSHNLRSHSTGISSLLELMGAENPEFAENELFKLANVGASNLKQTVVDLTEIVKANLDENILKDVNLYGIIQKNIDSLSMRIKDAQFSINIQLENELTIQGVPAYLDSMVLNFLTNAIKYRSKERAAYLNIYAKENEKHLILFFEDNGLGIDLKKYGDKVFGLYKTFHRANDSRGVGLFITKNQVESMGGRIEVESKVNVGTTFKVFLLKNE